MRNKLQAYIKFKQGWLQAWCTWLVIQGHRQCHRLIEHTYDFLFIFRSNSFPILYCVRDMVGRVTQY